MNSTTVIFVHGFRSSPACWKPFHDFLDSDSEMAARGYRMLWDFNYSTKWVELNPTKRIPEIEECGNYLRDYLQRHAPDGNLMLVGHSMGGLIIQSYLVEKITRGEGCDLARIRTVILFATPNRGSTILSTVRDVVSSVFSTPQEQELEVLDKEVARTSDTITRCILGAEEVNPSACPIPFQVFWGMQDKVVPEVSARGPFVEASPLPGGHSEIIQPQDRNDERLLALKNALLNPVGHPAIYEMDLWEVKLTVTPNDPQKAINLRGFDSPVQIHTDNVAVRLMSFVFSKQNRCVQSWEQTYRSKDGFVEVLSLSGENQASKASMSEYYETAKKFSYVFTPAKSDSGTMFSMKLRIYNGFGEGQRNWHDHLKPNARCRQYRFTLNLTDYGKAGYTLTGEPTLYFFGQDVMDHQLCNQRVGEDPRPPLPGNDPWVRTWEMENVRGGVVDLSWGMQMAGVATAPERTDYGRAGACQSSR
jgi:pimeloyl-ACP methyl ester carboxylesterase